jgi:cbb3-type cytochrome oxidase cytochrome c subunit
MAATDQTYRPQRILDIVFGVSCVLMLLSIIWMFAQDYYREFKVEARDFRDVEEAMATRELVRRVPKEAEVQKAEEKLRDARKALADVHTKEYEKEIKDLTVKKVVADNEAQKFKADVDSLKSIRDIQVDKRNNADSESARDYLDREIEKTNQRIAEREQKRAQYQGDADQLGKQLDEKQQPEKAAKKGVDEAEKELKALTDEFDRFAKLAVQKQWKVGDRIRGLPVLDAFASPTKIDQITLTDLPIDYSFKYVTRFDRCTTCHLGIDKPTYDRETLRGLRDKVPERDEQRLANAIDLFRQRQETLGSKAVTFDFKDLRLEPLKREELPDTRINEYCVHPRLDLFVGDKSPHPKQNFGCTICHGGQGSATDFVLASHTPNNAREKKRWESAQDWHAIHDWEFPMLPQRFVESSCIKCHYQVTDLTPQGNATEYRAGNPVETPGAKVLRGYELVRENGCFGCHEISGINKGRWVGPDLRLEPSPPLEALSAGERAKMLADPLNPPGTMRKVGPSLRRIAEKTDQTWARRWLESPRSFRPDTKMPHFYNLSNNRPDVLPAGQQDFPAAEIHGIAYYLFQESGSFLQGKDTFLVTNQERKKTLQEKLKNNALLTSDKEKLEKELEDVNRFLEQALAHEPIKEKIKEVPAWLKTDANDKVRQEHVVNGRMLFTERGCLACHSHQGTAQPPEKLTVVGSATFAPNLSQTAAKIKPEVNDPDAKWRWLIQWITNPMVHHPRTRMPVTHLTQEQAGEIAAWLMRQPARDDFAQDPKEPETEVFQRLAQVWLEKATDKLVAKEILDGKGLSKEREAAMKVDKPDADELRLQQVTNDEDWKKELKWYVGKKAIAQLGCYGCHDIPGFETAKPIGTALNDWGKKDPERLAFEDVIDYVNNNYHIVTQRDNPRDLKKPAMAWHGVTENGKEKRPYEEYFYEELLHRQRDGFLHQKLLEPRSYDHARERNWDERLRMPQFQFARQAPVANATAEDKARAERDEAEAREEVMTFILGLVAEPIPLKFVHNPPEEKLAVAKGVQVLEKYNCGGCHTIRAGTYEFKLTSDIFDVLEANAGDPKTDRFPGEHWEPFLDQSEWTGRPQTAADRLTIHGIPNRNNENEIFLTEAVRFTDREKQSRDVPAANSMPIPEPGAGLLSRQAPWGGRLVDLLIPNYLPSKNETLYKGESNYPTARAALPPPLLREGEKAQTSWLFQFLRDPQEIRPNTILRMPKFNMSDEEAMSLVNYFAAVDKMQNPAGGLNYPYATVPQRFDDYWTALTKQYVERLKAAGVYDARKKDLDAVGDWFVKEQTADLERQVVEAQAVVKNAKDKAAKEKADLSLKTVQDQLNKLKEASTQKQIKERLVADWETSGAYTTDALRVVANYNNDCLGCHSIGRLTAKKQKELQGPPLDLAWQRLRPEWTARWIANPKRMISYPTPMPANFVKNQQQFPEFVGTPFEKVLAVRDLLMVYPKVVDKPVNRFFLPVPQGETQ